MFLGEGREVNGETGHDGGHTAQRNLGASEQILVDRGLQLRLELILADCPEAGGI